MHTEKGETWPENLSPKQSRFLAAYVEEGTVAGANKRTGISRRSHYDWIQQPAYAAAFADAEERAIELLESEIRRRAMHGEEVVVYQGKLQYEPKRDKYGREVKDANGNVVYSDRPLTVRRPSDILAMFLAKAKRPQTYRDNSSVQLAGPGGAPIAITVKFQDAEDGRPSVKP